ncbi:hypothetical protein KEJ34_08020 [Candidatus Bathyarchaeota archaeon]|nr:hypothetical protein [Candidatus Bathyarchaeota archaeon]
MHIIVDIFAGDLMRTQGKDAQKIFNKNLMLTSAAVSFLLCISILNTILSNQHGSC